ncbi:MAG: MFS transporter [Acidobacteriota bacterium]
MLSGRKPINPSLVAILSEGFSSRLSFGIISFALPLYAYRKLGLTLTEVGFLFSLNLIAEQVFKPLMGWVADRVGLRLSLTVAIALRSAVALLLAFATLPWQVYSIRLLHGVSESLRDPSVNALIAENSEPRTMGSSFAWYSTAKMVAGSIGKALGGLLLVWTGTNYSTVFLIAFTLSVLPLYVVVRYVRSPRRHEEERSGDEMAAQAAELMTDAKPRRRTLFSVAVLGFLLATTAHMVQQLFPLLATEYAGLSVAQTSLIYALSVAILLVSGPLFGWFSDNVSRKAVLMVRGVANSVSSLLYWLLPSFGGMAVASIADSLGKAAFRPAWGALMAQMSNHDRRRRARTMGFLSLGEGLGETLGPILGGLLWHFWGVPVLFAVRLLLALIGEVYALRINTPAPAGTPQPVIRPIE